MIVAKSCVTLWDPMDYSPSGSSVHGISQARILESVAISFSRKSSQLKDPIRVSCIAGGFFAVWATGVMFNLPQERSGSKDSLPSSRNRDSVGILRCLSQGLETS